VNTEVVFARKFVAVSGVRKFILYTKFEVSRVTEKRNGAVRERSNELQFHFQ